jgi:hypothetical protein
MAADHTSVPSIQVTEAGVAFHLFWADAPVFPLPVLFACILHTLLPPINGWHVSILCQTVFLLVATVVVSNDDDVMMMVAVTVPVCVAALVAVSMHAYAPPSTDQRVCMVALYNHAASGPHN